MSETELKPCPFCGSVEIEPLTYYGGVHYIYCGKCLARTGVYDSISEAAKAWNKRCNNEVKDEK